MSRPTVYGRLSTAPWQDREAQLARSGNAPVDGRGADSEAIVAGLQALAPWHVPLEQDRVRARPAPHRERSARKVVPLAADLLELDVHRGGVGHEPLDRGPPAGPEQWGREPQTDQPKRRRQHRHVAYRRIVVDGCL